MPYGSRLCDALAAGTGTPQCPAQHHRHGGADPRRCAPAARNGGSGSLLLPFSRGAIIGLGLIGSSLARAIQAQMPTVRVTGHDARPEVRATAAQTRFCDAVPDHTGAAVLGDAIVILCVPVAGQIGRTSGKE